MNRWLVFFYDGYKDQAIIVEFAHPGANPLAYEDEIDAAIIEAELSTVSPTLNGAVDVSDINTVIAIVDNQRIETFQTLEIK